MDAGPGGTADGLRTSIWSSVESRLQGRSVLLQANMAARTDSGSDVESWGSRAKRGAIDTLSRLESTVELQRVSVLMLARARFTSA
jgi:hypothetical protein